TGDSFSSGNNRLHSPASQPHSTSNGVAAHKSGTFTRKDRQARRDQSLTRTLLGRGANNHNDDNAFGGEDAGPGPATGEQEVIGDSDLDIDDLSDDDLPPAVSTSRLR